MKRGKSLMALTVVVFALAAALYVIPSFAHPYWLDEEEGEEFVPPAGKMRSLHPPGGATGSSTAPTGTRRSGAPG